MKSTYAILTAPRKIEFFQEDLPPVAENDMIIRTISVGLCHSELPAYLGTEGRNLSPHGYMQATTSASYPAPLGHEPVAEVVEVGKNVKRFKKGDKISGRFRGCLRDYTYIGHADEFVGGRMLFKIPETTKPVEYCLSEPMECIVTILKAAACEYGQRVAVIGCGFMGLMIIAGLRRSGAKQLTAVDILDSKLDLALRYGATDTINPAKYDVTEEGYRLTSGEFYDVVVEITGGIKGLDTALRITKPAHKNSLHAMPYQGHSKVLMVSLYSKGEILPPTLGTNLMLKAPILISAHPQFAPDPAKNHMEAIESYITGRLPIDEMITHSISFKDVATGYSWLIQPPEGYIKGIVTFP